MMRISSRHFSKLLILLLLLSPFSVSATSVRPLNIDQITDKARLIIHARVTGQEVTYDDISKRVVTITRFDVIDTLKGSTGDTHSIKQLGGQLPGSRFVHRIHGIPRFINGEEYVVFLPAVSRLGFSSPIGLAQGNFRIDLEGDTATVRNSKGNANSNVHKHDAGLAARASGHPVRISLDEFKSDIRRKAGDR